jgi:uncharacterized membrane protein YdfJ with MMPL/SSD domain
MTGLIRFVLRHARVVFAIWALVVACATVLALRLPSVIHGGTDAIRDSESGQVTSMLDQQFGPGASFSFAVLVTHRELSVDDPKFPAAVDQVTAVLRALPRVKAVSHHWRTGAAELLGRDRKSALLLVTPNVDSYFEAEELTGSLHEALRGAVANDGFTTMVTGAPAMFYDITRHSSSDLLRAERIGIPITLLILLIAFRAPVAAVLPLALAFVAVSLSSAALYVLSRWMPVSIFAHNVVTMIGLGIGVDYALLAVSRFRRCLAQGCGVPEAVLDATSNTASAVVVSGVAVGIGFLALFLVHARFLHGMAVGGLFVVFATLIASLTLLPVLLLWCKSAMNWPQNLQRKPSDGPVANTVWSRFAMRVMAHPWRYLVPAAAVLALLAAPAYRMQARNVSVGDMPSDFEARLGLDALQRNFEAGWMGPIILLLQTEAGTDFQHADSQPAALAIAARLGRDPRVARVQTYPRSPGAQAQSPLVILLIPTLPPERVEMIAFVRELRAGAWPEAESAGIAVKVGGASAMIADFDAELLGSLWRIVPAVLGVTFVVLLIAFRSVLIPVKAVLTNLLSVLAAYGFLVLVFQEGVGASLLRIDPPGGLNSLVVLMLFTILFGLSTDYEVFLLRQVEEAYRRSGENRTAVATGLARSAGLITSAAAIMVCLFGSFGFTHLTATREFGLGLAFAVALDATLIRLLLVPALMALLGDANWWWPTGRGPRANTQGFTHSMSRL